MFGFSLGYVLAIKEKDLSANHNWLPQGAVPCASLMGTGHSQSVWSSPWTWPGSQSGTILFIRVISKAVTKVVSMEIDSITSQLVHSLPPILDLFSLFPWLLSIRLVKSSNICDTLQQWKEGQRCLGGGWERKNLVGASSKAAETVQTYIARVLRMGLGRTAPLPACHLQILANTLGAYWRSAPNTQTD